LELAQLPDLGTWTLLPPLKKQKFAPRVDSAYRWTVLKGHREETLRLLFRTTPKP
jgi:hypothetical protein